MITERTVKLHNLKTRKGFKEMNTEYQLTQTKHLAQDLSGRLKVALTMIDVLLRDNPALNGLWAMHLLEAAKLVKKADKQLKSLD